MKASTKNVAAVAAMLALSSVVLLWQMGLFARQNAAADILAKPLFSRPHLLAENGIYGLKLGKEAIQALQLQPKTISHTQELIALAPMIGTINYDNARLFQIRPRFTGEVIELKEFDEAHESIVNGSTTFKTCKRPLRFGDKVKQGETLLVFWSQTLGQQKAAFVDAICSLHLSQTTFDKYRKLYEAAGISELMLRQAERQVEQDTNAMNTAERTLRIWKLTEEEIKSIRDEANAIRAKKAKRDPVQEVKKWARVEVKVPWFDRENPNRELTVVEINTHVDDKVDPGNFAVPLLKIADLSRVQIWAHPPEECLPILRERMKAGPGALKWQVRFQSEPATSQGPGLELDVAHISPSLEPSQRTPMVIGYLSNPEGKYLIGQFVTASILVAAPHDTVAIPTTAVNPLEGKDYVFVVRPGTDDEFLIRRVSVVQSFQKITLVRTKLTPDEERDNTKVGPEDYKIEPLHPGERIIAHGVLELTAALEEARNSSTHEQ